MKTICPERLDKQTREGLKKKEQAYIYLLYQKRYTRQQIMDKLFIDNDRTFHRLQLRVRNIVTDKLTANQENRLKKINTTI